MFNAIDNRLQDSNGQGIFKGSDKRELRDRRKGRENFCFWAQFHVFDVPSCFPQSYMIVALLSRMSVLEKVSSRPLRSNNTLDDRKIN